MRPRSKGLSQMIRVLGQCLQVSFENGSLDPARHDILTSGQRCHKGGGGCGMAGVAGAPGDLSSWGVSAWRKEHGPGAKDAQIFGHSVRGDQRITYANTPNELTIAEALQQRKWWPSEKDVQHSIDRCEGEATSAPCWVHGPGAQFGADNGTVHRLEWRPEVRERRICHSATALGPPRNNWSILAMVSPERQEALVAALKDCAKGNSKVCGPITRAGPRT